MRVLSHFDLLVSLFVDPSNSESLVFLIAIRTPPRIAATPLMPIERSYASLR
jgi:hypothetical protein